MSIEFFPFSQNSIIANLRTDIGENILYRENYDSNIWISNCTNYTQRFWPQSKCFRRRKVFNIQSFHNSELNPVSGKEWKNKMCETR